jgi:molecular chaperone HscB
MNQNYYELYQIKSPFQIDKTALRAKFMALSKQFHPDKVLAETKKAQADALQQMETINVAYKTLQNEETNIEYYLHINGIINADENYALPNIFLMETMELNEEIMDAKMEGDTIKLGSIEAKLIKDIERKYNELVALLPNTENNLKAKELFYKIKYFKRALALAVNKNVEM